MHGGELTVRDHGPGISAEDLAHVFDRFYRGAESRGRPGSGLGLAIVRQVVRQHGGTVTAERAPGGGTLMRVRLPGAETVAPRCSSRAVRAWAHYFFLGDNRYLFGHHLIEHSFKQALPVHVAALLVFRPGRGACSRNRAGERP